MRDAAESFKHEGRFAAEAEGDGSSDQIETELCWKQKVKGSLRALRCVSVPPVYVQVCGFVTAV